VAGNKLPSTIESRDIRPRRMQEVNSLCTDSRARLEPWNSPQIIKIWFKNSQGHTPARRLYFEIWVNFLVLGPTASSLHRLVWNLVWRSYDSPTPKLPPSVQRVAPAGDNFQNRPLSNRNTSAAAGNNNHVIFMMLSSWQADSFGECGLSARRPPTPDQANQLGLWVRR